MVNATSNGKEYDTSIHEITYDHINNEYFGEAAQIHAISFELLKPNDLKVGYIESGFDEVADYLSHVGFDITKLTEEDLNTGALSQYDTMASGIRAHLLLYALLKDNH